MTWRIVEMMEHIAKTRIKRLRESFASDPVASGVQEMFSSLGDMMSQPYSVLGTLTAAARALGHVLQTCHWQARGDAFYGDHKFFEELYEGVSSEVDMLAERAVGLGSPELVNPIFQLEMTTRFLSMFIGENASSFPRTYDLLKVAHNAESMFKGFVLIALESMEKNGELTPGVENMLGGIADTHEQHLYLLSQYLHR